MAWLPTALFFCAAALEISGAAFRAMDATVEAALGAGLALGAFAFARGRTADARRAGLVGLTLCAAGLCGALWLHGRV